MRVTDKLIQDAKKREKRKKIQGDEEETLTYFPRTRQRAVNQELGAFGSAMGEGINTRKSVFDDTAVFETGTGQKTR
jgi:hypothetical protein